MLSGKALKRDFIMSVKKFYLFGIALSILCLNETIAYLPTETKNPVEIIIIHGTFASNFSWYQEHGDFYQSIKQAALNKFGKDNFIITPFKWSGYLGCMPRVEAAVDLARHILNSNKKIYSIGHSHGGNVVNIASQILELLGQPISKDERLKKIDKIANVLFKKGQQEFSKWNNPTRNQGYTEESFDSVFTTLSNAIEGLIQYLENTPTSRGGKYSHQPIIEENYLLATPVDTDDILPSTKIIKETFSFYSKADIIQTIFGLYEKKYKLSRKLVTNISVVCAQANPNNLTPKIIYNYPSHADLHMPIIGKMLFLIPSVCHTLDDSIYEKRNEFEITFFENGCTPKLFTPNEVSNTTIEMFLDNLREMFGLVF